MNTDSLVLTVCEVKDASCWCNPQECQEKSLRLGAPTKAPGGCTNRWIRLETALCSCIKTVLRVYPSAPVCVCYFFPPYFSLFSHCIFFLAEKTPTGHPSRRCFLLDPRRRAHTERDTERWRVSRGAPSVPLRTGRERGSIGLNKEASGGRQTQRPLSKRWWRGSVGVEFMRP